MNQMVSFSRRNLKNWITNKKVVPSSRKLKSYPKSLLLLGGLSASCLGLTTAYHDTLTCESTSRTTTATTTTTTTREKDISSVIVYPELPSTSLNNMERIQMLEYENNMLQTTVHSSSAVVSYCSASYRANHPLEDRWAVKVLPNEAYFALFDGHGGWQMADFAQQKLIPIAVGEIAKLKNTEDNQKYDRQLQEALRRSFIRTDQEFMAKVSDAFKLGFGTVARVGACALVAYIHTNTMYVANAGDIRAIVGRRVANTDEMVALSLSNDHNARIASEKIKLAEEHPGEEDIVRCKNPTACYVKGRLQATRSLGDYYLKNADFNGPPVKNGDHSRGRHIPDPYSPPYISASPEIFKHEITEDDSFIVLGTDGLWDFLENQEVVEIVNEQIKIGTPHLACQALINQVIRKAALKSGLTFEEILAFPPGSARRRRHDDTTVTVIFISKQDTNGRSS